MSTHTEATKTKISQSMTGRTLSKEHADKVRIAKLGYVTSSDTKAKISLANKGRKHHPKTITKMCKIKRKLARETMRRVKVDGVIYRSTSKACEKLGMSYSKMYRRLNDDKFPNYIYLRPLKCSEEQAAAFSKRRIRKPCSEATKAKMRASRLGYVHSMGSKERIVASLTIIQVKVDGVVYTSIRKAAEALGVAYSTIYKRLYSPRYPTYIRL